MKDAVLCPQLPCRCLALRSRQCGGWRGSQAAELVPCRGRGGDGGLKSGGRICGAWKVKEGVLGTWSVARVVSTLVPMTLVV